MSYVAAVCGKGAEVNQVKEQLLQSNPVLEGKNLTEYVWHIPCVCAGVPAELLWKNMSGDASLLFGVQNHRRCFMWIHLQGFLDKKMVSLMKEELRKLGHTSQPPPAALRGLTLS